MHCAPGAPHRGYTRLTVQGWQPDKEGRRQGMPAAQHSYGDIDTEGS